VIAVFQENTQTFTDAHTNFGSITISSAPDWAYLYSVAPKYKYSRLQTEYTFNLTLGKLSTIANPSEEIRVDFPQQFQMNDNNIACSTATKLFEQAGAADNSLTCSIDDKSVVITKFKEDYVGYAVFSVKNIQNPMEQGLADRFRVEVYDKANEKIVERSFENLDPFQFAYNYNGPLLKVNNAEEIIVERGTETQDLYITMDYPCARNLTLEPTVAGNVFSVKPAEINFTLGEIRTKFRVSVPKTTNDGVYYITWKTKHDATPEPLYTPLENTRVKVTRSENMQIEIGNINDVPFPGNSLSIPITTTYSPN